LLCCPEIVDANQHTTQTTPRNQPQPPTTPDYQLVEVMHNNKMQVDAETWCRLQEHFTFAYASTPQQEQQQLYQQHQELCQQHQQPQQQQQQQSSRAAGPPGASAAPAATTRGTGKAE